MEARFWMFQCTEPRIYVATWRSNFGWLAIPYHQKYLAEKFGLLVSPQTMERWWRLWAWVYWLDGLLDNQPPELRDQARHYFDLLVKGELPDRDAFPSWVSSDLLAVVQLFNNSVEELGPAARYRIVDLASQIADYVPRKASRRWVWPYALDLVREGRLTVLPLAEACMTGRRAHNEVRAHLDASRENSGPLGWPVLCTIPPGIWMMTARRGYVMSRHLGSTSSS